MVQHLTVAENIFLGREKLDSFHMVSQNEMNKQAKPILEIDQWDWEKVILKETLRARHLKTPGNR